MCASREVLVQPLAPVSVYVQFSLFKCVVLQDRILGPRNFCWKLAGLCLLQKNLGSSCEEYFARKLIPRATALGCSMIGAVGGVLAVIKDVVGADLGHYRARSFGPLRDVLRPNGIDGECRR